MFESSVCIRLFDEDNREPNVLVNGEWVVTDPAADKRGEAFDCVKPEPHPDGISIEGKPFETTVERLDGLFEAVIGAEAEEPDKLRVLEDDAEQEEEDDDDDDEAGDDDDMPVVDKNLSKSLTWVCFWNWFCCSSAAAAAAAAAAAKACGELVW
jgi:hypothetical protein